MRGYTLVELIVVIVLVGLIGALTLPRLPENLLSDALKASTRRLASVMRELRSEAQLQHKNFFLRFDLDAGTYWIEAGDMNMDDRALARENGFLLRGGARISGVWLHGQGTVVEGETAVAVTRKGYVQPSAIHLTDGAGRKFTLRFRPFLSKEEIYDEYVDFREW